MAIQRKSPILQGFEQAKPTKQRKRLVIALDGKERTGKTTFGMSAPGPMAYFPLDPGREGVIDKYIEEGKIYLPVGDNGRPETFNYKDATSQVEFTRIWDKLKACYLTALSSDVIRSIVIDTFSESYELVRLARLGKLTQVMPHHYTVVNAELRDMVKRIYDTDKNLILIHKVKKEYINDKWSGEYERQGFGDVGYLVQINLTLSWNEDEGFQMLVRDCRQNMDIAGKTLPMNNFPFLAMNIYPESEEEEWT